MPMQRRRDQEFERSPRLKFLQYVRNAELGRRGIFRTRARASLECGRADGVFIRGENTVQREGERRAVGEIFLRKRERGVPFISIDRRSRGVGEIVYLARREYSVGHRAIFLNLDARGFTAVVTCRDLGTVRGLRRATTTTTTTIHHHPPRLLSSGTSLLRSASTATFGLLISFHARARPRYAHGRGSPMVTTVCMFCGSNIESSGDTHAVEDGGSRKGLQG